MADAAAITPSLSHLGEAVASAGDLGEESDSKEFVMLPCASHLACPSFLSFSEVWALDAGLCGRFTF
jgi:hypothetical protein